MRRAIAFLLCLASSWPLSTSASTLLTNTPATSAQLAHLFESVTPALYFCQTGIYDDIGNLDDDWGQLPSPGRITSAAWDIGNGRYLYAYQLSNPNWLEGGTNYGNWDVALSGHTGYFSVPLRQLQTIPIDYDGDQQLDTSFRLADHACSAMFSDDPEDDCAPLAGAFSVFTTGPDACAISWSDYYRWEAIAGPDAIVEALEDRDGIQGHARFAVRYYDGTCCHGIYAATQIFGFVTNAPPAFADGQFLDGASASIRIVAPVPRVLLVHGICDVASTWDPFAQVLTDSLIEVDRVQYGSLDYNLPPRDYVYVLTDKLNSMDAHSVTVVAHSMGGLIARDYRRNAAASGERDKIASLVTIATPHHGSDVARGIRRMDAAIGRTLPYPPALGVGILGLLYESIRRNTACQLDPLSRGALADLSPGSIYLNALNYGSNLLNYDRPNSRGGAVHNPETEIDTGARMTAIAGSQSFCGAFASLKPFFWGFGSKYHQNDGVVAVGSAKLTTGAATSMVDGDLSLLLTHVHAPPLLCGASSIASADLARNVVGVILRGSATAPQPPTLAAEAEQLEEDDSTVVAPALVDTVSRGLLIDRTLTVPPTGALDLLLVSQDARFTVSTPSGALLSSGSVEHFGVDGSGFEGFHVETPESGAWVIHVDASLSADLQAYAIVLGYKSTKVPSVTLVNERLHPGDSLHVRADLRVLGVLDPDVTWEARVVGPDSNSTVLALHDDGAHDDDAANDGVFGGAVLPAGGLGDYQVQATATLPTGEALVCGTLCEVALFADLVIEARDIYLSRNVVASGDSVTVHAVVHNVGTVDATGVRVTFQDQRTLAELGTATVDVGAGTSATVAVPWVAAAPDTHVIKASIAPNLPVTEASYANNWATRAVIIGVPVGVERPSEAGQLWLAAPRPNPSRGALTLWFSVPRSGDVALDVFDLLGRRVNGWQWRGLAPGAHAVEWNGVTSSGHRVRAGVLVCRLRAGGEVRTRKIVIRP